MKRRKTSMPTKVRQLATSDSTEKKAWSKPNTSMLHQLTPAPVPGVARNINTTNAVPSSVRRAASLS